MNRPRLQAAIVLVVIFAVGAAAGGAGATWMISRRIAALLEGSPKMTMARLYGAELDRRLHLTGEQRAEVERIVFADHAAVAREFQRIEPDLSTLRRARHARIMALLDPEQRQKAEELERKFERRHREELDLPPENP